MDESLDKKIDAAIKLLQSTCKNEVVELCYSDGKDSDVILKLAKLAGIKYRAIYRCTTIDPPGTIAHCIENNIEIIRPSKSFLSLLLMVDSSVKRLTARNFLKVILILNLNNMVWCLCDECDMVQKMYFQCIVQKSRVQ